MPNPLPLTVYGPVTPLSPSVLVSGVLKNAVVTILDNGSAIGHATANVNGQFNVPLAKPPTVGHNITAIQKSGSGTSEPSQQTIPVVDVPNPLPTPSIASALNTCMTDIMGDNLVPGATVITSIGGSAFGSAPASATTAWLGINPITGITAGSTVTIHQEATIAGVLRVSPAVQSLPVPQYHLVAHTLPPPVLGPLVECIIGRNFLQAEPGATLVIENEKQSETWINPAGSYYGNDGLPLRKGKATATQSMPRCELKGTPADFPVTPATPPGAPIINQIICPGVMAVMASGLQPGAILDITRNVFIDGGVSSSEQVGDRGVGAETELIALPPDLDLTDPDGQVVLGFRQSGCGGFSDVAFVKVVDTGHTFSGPSIGGDAPFECTRAIPIKNAVPGALVQAFDADTKMPIGDPTGPITSQMLVFTWFPMTAKQNVFVRQTGCGANGDTDTVSVQVLPDVLPPPEIIRPVRPGAPFLTVKNIIPGARLFLVVQNELRPGSYVVYSKTATIPVTGPALVNQQIAFVVQTLCTHTSDRGGKAIQVEIGNLKASVTPSTVVRGTKANLVVTAVDAQTGAAVPAQVLLNGAVAGITGAAIPYSPKMGDPNPAGLARSTPGYNDGGFTVVLTDPPTKWTVVFNVGNCQLSIDSVSVNVTDLKCVISPDYGGSAVTVNLKPSAVSASGKGLMVIPTGPTKTVSVTLSGIAKPVGGTVNGLTVAPTPFTFGPVTKQIAYIGQPTETIGWLLQLSYLVDPSADGDETGKFWIDPVFMGITP
jgi:hypothetical protein